MRIIKLAFGALFAVLAFGVMVSSALAAHPSFLTETGVETAFAGSSASSPIPTLRGLEAGVLFTIACKTFTASGHVLPKSPLAHRIKIEFSGDCLLTIGTTKDTCVEPIVAKEALAELGLVTGKIVGILLAPNDRTKIFAEPSCGGMIIPVEGAVVGEIPEISKKGVSQYNKELNEQEQVFEAVGKNTENQEFTSIELLGANMTGVGLKTANFFGGKASEEAIGVLTSTTGIEVCTIASCP